MSQLQEVVRCYSCETFQVQIKKIAKKWTCKICNEKQSLKKVYFTGLGAECRNIVKEFNMKRGEMAENKETLFLKSTDSELADNFEGNPFEEDEIEYNHKASQSRGSKWTAYLTPEEIKEAEKALAFKNKSSIENDSQDLNSFDGHETFDNEEDFDCDSYLQMNSVNQENIKQNNTKTFSSNTKRQSNTFQSAQTKKSKWSSFTSSEVPSENNQTDFEQPNILQQRTNFPQSNTLARINFPQNNTSSRTNFPQNNTSHSNNTKSWPSFLKKSLGEKSFQSSKTSISAKPLLPKPTVSQPVLTDFTKKFLVNRKQN